VVQYLFANIIVDISHEKLDRSFQYLVPEHLKKQVAVGSIVKIPFGKGNRITKGYVICLSHTPEYEVSRTKEILEVLTDGKELTGEDRLVTLAGWIRDMYGSTMSQALRTVLPVKKKIKQQKKRTVRLLLSEEAAAEKAAFYEKKHQKARLRLLQALMEEGEIPYEFVTGKLNISTTAIRAMEEQQILVCDAVTVYRNPVHISGQQKKAVQLNEEQQEIVDDLTRNWENKGYKVSLIHGVTGSGKTEVYMELIAYAVSRGEQAIVLIPEIALTYQTVMRFYRRFGERISIIHSRLSPGERYDQFLRAKRGDIDVMIGPRSALFTPFPKLGIIIIDEEHEPTYQSESIPRYHAREVAIRRAQLEDARVVLGSATPSLEAYSRALAGEYQFYRLKKRARAAMLPQTKIVDMRQELKEGNRLIFSRALQKLIADRLKKKQQVILFLNRRGYSGFLSCRSCGHVIMCPHCDVSLALHNHGRLVCHYCGYEERRPQRCPQCGSEFISGFGIGTQQVEMLTQKLFPQANVLRMDMDTTKEKDGHEKILSAFADGEADILIGTQMIVKGHDFPNVTLVGILSADLSLYADDYRASERTFQLLTQAAGRAGRAEVPGEVVIQTYDPDHYCIRTAAAQDYEQFYEEEIGYRMVAGYPPSKKMLTIFGSGKDEPHLQTAMEYLKKIILSIYREEGGHVIGPADGSVSRIQDTYRKVLYVKSDSLKELLAVKERLEQYMEINAGYRSVNIQFDMS
jgi:primosomal protein N' (replication factor Y)